jgi:hypothetical protein
LTYPEFRAALDRGIARRAAALAERRAAKQRVIEAVEAAERAAVRENALAMRQLIGELLQSVDEPGDAPGSPASTREPDDTPDASVWPPVRPSIAEHRRQSGKRLPAVDDVDEPDWQNDDVGEIPLDDPRSNW